jgi:hypothetical protein
MNEPPVVHLAENFAAANRSATTGRAYPIGEYGRPTPGTTSPAGLANIVRYLEVEKSARYQPADGQTFCNIYACDYCYLAGAYLPRVWWTAKALADFAAGRPVAVKYGETVAELNANSLQSWLHEFGPSYGWTQATSLDQLQRAANAGQVSVISAQRSAPAKPGHIAVVVPESTPPEIAETTPAGVRVPLQSQAGRSNYCFSCEPGRWWEGTQFAAYGFWIHT